MKKKRRKKPVFLEMARKKCVADIAKAVVCNQKWKEQEARQLLTAIEREINRRKEK